MTKIKITWHFIEFNPNETKGQLSAKLIEKGANPQLFKKSVYVIRLRSPFSVSYPQRHTPTLYIGEGNILSRLNAHRKWINRLQKLGYPFPIEVACCFPRVNGNAAAHKVFEAHLLNVFFNRYGSLPLKNSNNQTKVYAHQYERTATSGILGPGSGNKHNWAISPLPANPFQAVFSKTHGN
ncbi:MAG: hypothetical protein ACOYB1_01780 [Limnohabitans sp.]